VKKLSLRSGLLATTTICGAALSTMAGGVLLATVATMLPATAQAQDYTSGVLQGTIVDSGGAPVSDATVTVTSNDTGVAVSSTTSANGAFFFASLPAATYTVTVAASGYDAFTDSNVDIAPSKTANVNFALNKEGEATTTVVVKGTSRKLDFSTSTTGIVVDVPKLAAKVPLGRDLTSIIMLAPSTSRGDAAFGNLASIGGASVAENAYYINGMNVTNFNNYVGSSMVPFDFYKSVEVKEGGYPAEFGRATGGVVNAVTKSGTNEFKGAIHFNFAPDQFREDAPNTYAALNQFDRSNNADTIVELSGPLIKDKLFAYALIQHVDRTDWNGDAYGNMIKDRYDQNFYGLKLDGYLTPKHHFELTYMDNTRTIDSTIYSYDGGTATVNADGSLTVNAGTGALTNPPAGEALNNYGDPSYVFKYTGKLTDWLTVSAAYGKNGDKDEFVPLFGDSAESFVRDSTTGRMFCGTEYGCNGQQTTVSDLPQRTQRTFYRADADMYFNLFGSHHVRTGWEQEENNLVHYGTRTGPGTNPVYYRYYNCGVSLRCSTGTGATYGLTSSDYYVEVNYYKTGGSFDSKNIAFYVEDEWKINSNWTVNFGVRNDQFNNYTANGSQYVDFNNLNSPRIGVAWDPNADGRSKFTAFYGTYYLPIAGNTAYRQGAQEYYFREFWVADPANISGVGAPTLTQQLTGWTGATACPYPVNANGSTSAPAGTIGCTVTGDGEVQDPTASVSQNLKATEEAEFILGYERKFGDLWTLGLTYTHRELVETAEDSAIDAAVNAYCAREGITGCSSIWSGYNQYVINNPGHDMQVVLNHNINGESTPRTITLSHEDLGYPQASRKLDQVAFNFKRAFDGKWMLQGSYTWSKLKGNSEGYVQSDFGQDDAGITQDFDQPGFAVGAYGDLPNAREHRLKVFGYYQVNDKFSLGGNALIQSPRKLSCFGFDPTNNYDNFENGYGAASHYCGGVLSPRGTAQESDWIYQFDVSGRYDIDLDGRVITLRADIFNILNAHGIDKRYEIGENDVGSPNINYHQPTQYQTPRYVRFGVDINF